MRRLFFILTVFLALAFSSGCSKPKVIPDSTLTQILAEIYLTNAYYNVVGLPQKDSFDMYTPILAEYGYDVRDFTNTIANFSKRKSARIGNAVDKTIEMLERESSFYQGRVAVLDTIDAIASRNFTRIVYRDSLIQVRNIPDTSRLRIRIPVREGTYNISYNYYIDLLDNNRSLRTIFELRDSLGANTNRSINWINSRRRQKYTTQIIAKPQDDTLQIIFGNYPADLSRPHITIDSLEVRYSLPKERALDSLDKMIFDYLYPFDQSVFNEAEETVSPLPAAGRED